MGLWERAGRRRFSAGMRHPFLPLKRTEMQASGSVAFNWVKGLDARKLEPARVRLPHVARLFFCISIKAVKLSNTRQTTIGSAQVWRVK